jgi:dihydroorotate dehydrogenase
VLSAATALLRLMPAERAHRATIHLAKSLAPLLPKAEPDDPRLRLSVLGLEFPNPIGLAAGFDKDAEVPTQMLRFGFGFVECGTVTPMAQAGNDRPRLFRLAPDRAVINRMGFNNRGMSRAAAQLQKCQGRGIVAINIGANKESSDRIDDYRRCYQTLATLASYVAVNVSSPNTPGLRGLQNRDELRQLLSTLTSVRARLPRKTPILLKIAPDLDEAALDDIAEESIGADIEGLIVSNSTTSRPPGMKSARAGERGGLSGRPLFALSTALLRQMRRRVGEKLVLVGVGGVNSGADAYEKIRAGASLVQLYTALTFEGPDLVRRIKADLLGCLERDGFANLTAAIGADTR